MQENSHVVKVGDIACLVANDGELEVCARDFVDVVDPSTVALDCVGGQTNQLDATLCEFRLELGKSAQFGGTNWCVVLGVAEEDDPVVTNEFVEVDVAVCCLGVEVGGSATQAERWCAGVGAHDGGIFGIIDMSV